MNRSKIRYALFRCRRGTQQEEHTALLAPYLPQLAELGLDISDFTKEWDVHKTDLTQIVTGKIARNYNKDVPLFDGQGKLVED